MSAESKKSPGKSRVNLTSVSRQCFTAVWAQWRVAGQEGYWGADVVVVVSTAVVSAAMVSTAVRTATVLVRTWW
ncbi:MAG TPA: hypothetical protein VN616_12775 [Puia sp.]|nr:hypothetical protein [Puia sp.]